MQFKTKFFMAVFAGLLTFGSVADAQEMKFFRIGTGGAGGDQVRFTTERDIPGSPGPGPAAGAGRVLGN